MNRIDFKHYEELLNNTIISGNAKVPSDSLKATYDYVNSVLPTHLYRFRRCNELNFDAFYNDQMWFSSGSEMNDDFDARLSYDVESIQKWIHSFVDEDGALKPIEVVQQLGTLPNEINILFPQWKDAILNWLNNMPREEVISRSKQVVQYVESDLERGLLNIESKVQESIKYACLSESINSDMMWGTYSDNASGFALEYEFKSNSKPIIDRLYNCQGGNICLFPIVYKNQRIDGTEYAKYMYLLDLTTGLANQKGFTFTNDFFNNYFPCPDIFMLIKAALYKSLDWESEKEWRLFFLNYNSSDFDSRHLSVKLRPSGIYLGRRIKDINKEILIGFAKKKNIPVYQMKFSEDPKTYNLVSERIQL